MTKRDSEGEFLTLYKELKIPENELNFISISECLDTVLTHSHI